MSAARLTIEEAATELRAPSVRWLVEWLRKHPADKAGEPYFTPMGRDKVFHQSDIARIETALREGMKCRSHSDRRAPAGRRTTKSVAPISDAAWKRAAELTNDPSLSSGSATSRSASKPTSNGPRPTLKLIQGSQPS